MQSVEVRSPLAHFLEEVLEPEPERAGGASGADVEAEQAATLLLPHVQRRLGEGAGGEASEGDAPPTKRQRQTTAQERLRALVEEAGGADQVYPPLLGVVSCHDIAGIWVAFFSRCQRYRCGQGYDQHGGQVQACAARRC